MTGFGYCIGAIGTAQWGPVGWDPKMVDVPTKSDLGDWRMLVVMPGAELQAAVEGGELAAFGGSDPRYQALLLTQRGAKEYLSRFETPFGVKLEPSIVAAPASVKTANSDWVSEFRLSFSVPHVIRGRVESAGSGFGSGIPYSELFDFYPFGLSRDGEQITILAPGEFGTNYLSRFRGSYPFTVTSNPKHFRAQNDDEFCATLIKLWRSRPNDPIGQEFRSRVFRSLALADYALRALYANFGSPIDVGIPLALWTSAFETIAAPGIGEVKTRHVAEFIAGIPWSDERLQSREHEPTHFRPDPPGSVKVTLPVQVYGRVANLRNTLLHGQALVGPEPGHEAHWGKLPVQVPALYRCALLQALAAKGFGEFPSEEWFVQDLFEVALLGPLAGRAG